MTHRMLALTLSLLVAGCLNVVTGCADVGTEPEDGKGVDLVYTPPPVLSTEPGIPDQIGGFCLVTGCAAPTMAEGDLACQDAADLPYGCCIADACWRGFRFGPTCVNVGAAGPGETCPNDGDGDGLCSYLDRWYTSC